MTFSSLVLLSSLYSCSEKRKRKPEKEKEMRTRRGVCYPKIQTQEKKVMRNKKRAFVEDDDVQNCCKRLKVSPESTGNFEFFNELPEDLVLSILTKLSSSAGCPSDFINVLLTCKKLNALALNRQVLSKACTKSFAVKAKNWSESSHRFLEQCVDAGNVEASYTLGMIRFYCLENRRSGASLMAKAAMNSYAPALYSLAVIQFNGSGGSKNDKDLRAGVALCARAAFLGHIDALRELGHCLQDGYGVRRNITEGRRFLIHANAREVASVLFNRSTIHRLTWQAHHFRAAAATCPLLSDFGCTVPAPEAHLANRFLTEWFGIRGVVEGSGGDGETDDETGGLRQCSHSGCGRPETRRHEFRRCSVCGAVNYCSRACQALDWKLRHKVKCAPLEQLFDEEEVVVNGNGVENVVDDDDDEIMNVES